MTATEERSRLQTNLIRALPGSTHHHRRRAAISPVVRRLRTIRLSREPTEQQRRNKPLLVMTLRQMPNQPLRQRSRRFSQKNELKRLLQHREPPSTQIVICYGNRASDSPPRCTHSAVVLEETASLNEWQENQTVPSPRPEKNGAQFHRNSR